MSNVIAILRQGWHNTAQHRAWWVTALGLGLLVVAVFLYGTVSMCAALYHLVSPPAPRPDELTLKYVDRHEQDASLVAMFAAECVKLYETATTATVGSLNQCVSVPANGTAASQTAASATDISVYAPTLAFKDSAVSMWSVMVGVTVKEFGAAAPVRKYVWLPVALSASGGPRAMMLPDDRASALPQGPDVELDYTRDVAKDSPLYVVVSSFMTAFLHGPAEDVGKYVTADSNLVTLGKLYDKIIVDKMQADVAVDGPPQQGQQAHVLVTVTAVHDQSGKKAMQYPLTVVDAGGRWAVAGLDDVPANTGRLVRPGQN
ncbi:hypothetical protein MAHJHV58_00140 [Mycobacterium avium subsp. hominissuis]|uniref:conjugal transfer protein n=1 Tax=Mycobacterium avium TaxID=1764 RepID=UPI000450812F|nr:conjugal transfer protein [Mycobacterium avium]ETZ55300.1 hypothetical protein L838_0956 [Mycobacterium avium MAV_120709_2344]MCA4736659.1 conjugal transfer protein [Mycobacterium avium subsp. hominissuis]MCA4741248.1 conjugal transfer protein [Mycobacterium avium subsp. hominissuis]MCA4745947.1 conjugal transfer protein [Mycobacterium avium subsp. hominissuis]MCA4766121.1 conjugal transfer protein [Mycobacterium avium subsp. hominissuis]